MIYRFDDFELDSERYELRRSGENLHVEPQVFDLLLFLVLHRDEVVSRDQLFHTIWEGKVVSDATLNSRIKSVRQLLGDDGKRQRFVQTLPRRGLRFAAEVRCSEADAGAASVPVADERQEVRFCTTDSGVRVGYATAGSGPPLVKVANWLTHIEYDWQSPVWRPLLDRLCASRTVYRYDVRGTGLSDTELVNISFASFVEDLEAVVAANGLDRFDLFAMSQGAGVAIAYAACNPDKVTRLILHGGYAQGRNVRGDSEQAKAFTTLMRQGWGTQAPAFLRAFSSLYLPDGTPEQIGWLTDLQRITASAENAIRIRQACDNIDVTALLPGIRAPTLVLHAQHEVVAPFEQGRLLAAQIPDARFVTLDSANHVMLAQDRAWPRYVEEIDAFLAADG